MGIDCAGSPRSTFRDPAFHDFSSCAKSETPRLRPSPRRSLTSLGRSCDSTSPRFGRNENGWPASRSGAGPAVSSEERRLPHPPHLSQTGVVSQPSQPRQGVLFRRDSPRTGDRGTWKTRATTATSRRQGWRPPFRRARWTGMGDEPASVDVLRALPELYRRLHLCRMVAQGKLTPQRAARIYREATTAASPSDSGAE